MEAYELATPQKIRAAYVGDVELWLSCAGCGAVDVDVVGIVSDGPPLPGFGNVAVIDRASRPHTHGGPAALALYCSKCWPAVAAPPAEAA